MENKYSALWSWLLMRIIVFFNKSHEWHNRKIDLQDWYDHRTDLCQMFDIFFWFIYFAFLIIGLTLFFGGE